MPKKWWRDKPPVLEHTVSVIKDEAWILKPGVPVDEETPEIWKRLLKGRVFTQRITFMKELEPEVEIQIYRNNIKELQEQLQEAYKKIKKQGEIISNLEELLTL